MWTGESGERGQKCLSLNFQSTVTSESDPLEYNHRSSRDACESHDCECDTVMNGS